MHKSLGLSLLLSVFMINVSFRKPIASAGEFDVYRPDYDGLNKAILEKINAKRTQKNLDPLEELSSLQKTAIFLTRDLKLGRFQQLRNDRKVLQRQVELKSWKYGNTYTLLTVIIATSNAVNYRGGKFYFDKKDADTRNHLFYGKRPTKKEMEAEDYKTYPMDDFSQDEIAENIAHKFLSDKRTVKCLNTGYRMVGCSCYLEKKTLNRSKIPLIKAVFILAGKRLAL